MPTTTTTAVPPMFKPQAAGEGWNEYGRRAMVYALQLPADDYSQLSNDGLAAAGDACNHAMACRDVSPVTVACLTALQREIRRRLAGRQADTVRRLQGLQASHDRVFGAPRADVPLAAAEIPPAQGPQGGSKVPKAPRPIGPVPPAFQLPTFDLADAF